MLPSESGDDGGPARVRVPVPAVLGPASENAVLGPEADVPVPGTVVPVPDAVVPKTVVPVPETLVPDPETFGTVAEAVVPALEIAVPPPEHRLSSQGRDAAVIASDGSRLAMRSRHVETARAPSANGMDLPCSDTERASPRKALCVSIHDVAPATWPACLVLWQALQEVAPGICLTWLIVPRYHGRCEHCADMQQTLTALLAAGHELALHGYTHRDTGPPPLGWRKRFLRHIYTTREGEFAALDEAEALRRIDLGLAWFAGHGWPAHGFVPPAWLIDQRARAALRQRPFSYMTTLSHFEVLPNGPRLRSPSLVYTARRPAGRCLSPYLADAMAAALASHRLIRLSLHPADAAHPRLLRHAQSLVEGLLRQRQAMTKYDFSDAVRARFPAAVSQDGFASEASQACGQAGV